MPIATLKINGSEGPAVVESGQVFGVSLSFDPQEMIGKLCEYWLAYVGPQLISYHFPEGWSPGLKPVLDTPISMTPMVDFTFFWDSFQPGVYTFYFVVDTKADSVLAEPFYYDTIQVTVKEKEVIVPPLTDIILEDKLTDGKTIGKRQGGSFTTKGWKHTDARSKIIYDFPSMNSGRISFDVTNIGSKLKGGPPEYDYCFGLYDDDSGDKKADYTGAAFIEIRYNYTSRYSNKIKIQSGAGINHDEIDERLVPDTNLSFDSSKTYRHEIVFGEGKAAFYLNGKHMVTTTYKGTINWKKMFIGDTNYKGDGSYFTGMEGFTYSNILLKKS